MIAILLVNVVLGLSALILYVCEVRHHDDESPIMGFYFGVFMLSTLNIAVFSIVNLMS